MKLNFSSENIIVGEKVRYSHSNQECLVGIMLPSDIIKNVKQVTYCIPNKPKITSKEEDTNFLKVLSLPANFLGPIDVEIEWKDNSEAITKCNISVPSTGDKQTLKQGRIQILDSKPQGKPSQNRLRI